MRRKSISVVSVNHSKIKFPLPSQPSSSSIDSAKLFPASRVCSAKGNRRNRWQLSPPFHSLSLSLSMLRVVVAEVKGHGSAVFNLMISEPQRCLIEMDFG